VLNWSIGGPPSVVDYHQIVLLPLAYKVGLLPALLVGVFEGIRSGDAQGRMPSVEHRGEFRGEAVRVSRPPRR